jgi:hypothetical protein
MFHGIIPKNKFLFLGIFFSIVYKTVNKTSQILRKISHLTTYDEVSLSREKKSYRNWFRRRWAFHSYSFGQKRAPGYGT